MSQMRALAVNVANKIAAGEVVERRANAGVAELKLRLPENRS
jgi:DNA mismatch repair ATPase MutL